MCQDGWRLDWGAGGASLRRQAGEVDRPKPVRNARAWIKAMFEAWEEAHNDVCEMH